MFLDLDCCTALNHQMIEGCSIHIELSSVYLKSPVLLRLSINEQTVNSNETVFRESDLPARVSTKKEN